MQPVLSIDAMDLAVSPYPERNDKTIKPLDRFALRWFARVNQRFTQLTAPLSRIVANAIAQQSSIALLSDAEIGKRLRSMAPALVKKPDHPKMADALALIREASVRSLGICPYPVQLMGAVVLLQGKLAEMQTGEGKTLTAGLAACLAGVAGLPTHVVTVNDYLAERDAEKLQPLFAFFGLRAGTVIHGMSPDQKQEAYAYPIVYCTNKELVFDYLRDRVAMGGRVSRVQLQVRSLHGQKPQPLMLCGLHFAIVDEIDSILIDEARTPLILSEKAGAPPDAVIYQQAIQIAKQLEEGKHFAIHHRQQRIHIKSAGKQQLKEQTASLAGIWNINHAREHLALQALRALHLFSRDHHYLVADDEVQIIDEFTGRVLDGRKWEQGLHQMIEAKEDIPLSEPVQTLAKITYQRFFCRYLRLSGMTGTAQEVKQELHDTYGLNTVVIPSHRPCRRKKLPTLICADEAAKWESIRDFVIEQQQQGHPVLIGTRSVKASEHLSQLFEDVQISHRVLNARQDAEEAAIVADAGQPGQVTIATNMAGRGTDISLHPVVQAQEGLTVIVTEFHESARIDRQLVGRCARQGDPGGYIVIVAMTDQLFRNHGGWLYRWLIEQQQHLNHAIQDWQLALLKNYAQHRAERLNAKIRMETLRQDRQFDQTLAFAGNQI